MRAKLSIILLTASLPAAATDYTGIGTFLIGVPAFLIFNIVLGVFLALPASKARKVIATVLFVPMAFVGLIISQDAISVMERASWDWLTGAAFFVLAGLSLFLHYKLISRQPVPSPGGR